MLIGVILTVKINWKRKLSPDTIISLNKANLIVMTTQFTYYSFKKNYVYIVAAVLHTYANQTNETSWKNRTKFTGIFVFLVIKLETPLVWKK